MSYILTISYPHPKPTNIILLWKWDKEMSQLRVFHEFPIIHTTVSGKNLLFPSNQIYPDFGERNTTQKAINWMSEVVEILQFAHFHFYTRIYPYVCWKYKRMSLSSIFSRHDTYLICHSLHYAGRQRNLSQCVKSYKWYFHSCGKKSSTPHHALCINSSKMKIKLSCK